MTEHRFIPPEEEAMTRLLKEHRYDTTGLVLRLAWRTGLTRDEIVGITWDHVDLDASLLRLRDREVPLEEGTAEFLRRWRYRFERSSPYVAVSERFRRPMVPVSISTMARKALDSEGQQGVRLIDLRYDYIRRQFREHGWTYALRVSGVSLSTYRNGLEWLLEGEAPPPGKPAEKAPDGEFRLWRIMQSEHDTPAGIALWLTNRMGLQQDEIVDLTWDQVDFDENVLRLHNRIVPLEMSVRRVLKAEADRRKPGEDQHVILTPKSRKPMNSARLGTLMRDALIRGGLEDLVPSDLRRDQDKDRERKVLLDRLAERGSITRLEAEELLGVSKGMAYRRLLALTEEGAMVRVGPRYYPPGTAARPEEQIEAVLRQVRAVGSISRQETADLLHIGQRAASRLLRRMNEKGELALLRESRRYVLPAESAR